MYGCTNDVVQLKVALHLEDAGEDVCMENNTEMKREETVQNLIQLSGICKIYNPGENEVRALDHVDLQIDEGEFVAIIGQIHTHEYAGLSGCALGRVLLPSRTGCISPER